MSDAYRAIYSWPEVQAARLLYDLIEARYCARRAAAQKGLGNWATDKLGLSTVHVIPAAWDWRFSTTLRGGMFLMVTLTSDERIAGFFGVRSFASSDTGERDLFLEEEYTVTDDRSCSLGLTRSVFSFLAKKSITSNSGNLKWKREQMSNDKPRTSGGPSQRGRQPRPAAVTTQIQGGYQAPAGGGKPATPTTGSGVQKSPQPTTGSGNTKK